MAFVILQATASHPRVHSHGPLGRRSLRVCVANDDVRIEPESVYVIPSVVSAVCRNGHLVVSPAKSRLGPLGQSASDAFFVSLARDAEDFAACVLLNGQSPDGLWGLRALKSFGGFTVIQAINPRKYDSVIQMAIAAMLIDDVIELNAIPGRLFRHLSCLSQSVKNINGNGSCLSETPALLRPVETLLLDRTGHNVRAYRDRGLLRGLRRRQESTGALGLAGYVSSLASDEEEIDCLYRELVAGTSAVFRDPEAFRSLQAILIPDLLNRVRSRSFCSWVAGCSCGEEVYSIAMILHEALSHRGEEIPHLSVLGTDIDRRALKFADRGVYPIAVLGNLDPYLLAKHFSYVDRFRCKVRPRIRKMCAFMRHNLIRDRRFRSVDLISCRNLLIYFEEDLQEAVVKIMHASLKHRGYLFLGLTDPRPKCLNRLFREIDLRYNIFQRRD